MKQFIKGVMIAVYHFLNTILPKDRHLVVLSSGNGKSMGGNPGAIYEYAVRNSSGYRFVWFLTKEYLSAHPAEKSRLNGPDGSRTKIVTYHHPMYYFYMSRAGIWIFDSRQEPFVVKKRDVVYLQTWHGTPLKKLGLDLEDMNMAGEHRDIQAYAAAVKKEAASWDMLIAQNPFSHETFKRCFGYEGSILDIGYPRNDMLTAHAASAEGAGKDGLTDGSAARKKRTILYAPTWRDDRYMDNGWYEYSSPLDFEELEKSLGDRFTFIVRPHYLVKMKKGDIPESVIKSGFVRIASETEDIDHLYLAADAMITDYSSTMFDYSLLGRPMIFYVYDLDEYKNRLRGFYFDFENEAPGPLCDTAAEVAQALEKAFDGSADEDVRERAEAFRRKYNAFDDGNASYRAWEAVEKKLAGKHLRGINEKNK